MVRSGMVRLAMAGMDGTGGEWRGRSATAGVDRTGDGGVVGNGRNEMEGVDRYGRQRQA
jgi:hypothetical protein